MKSVLLAGIIIVNLALAAYATGVIIETRKKILNRSVVTFLTIGVVFDLISTICMIIGSGKALTFHGIIGYVALAGMLSDTVLSFRRLKKSGKDSPLPKTFLRWTQVAFAYWVIAYITGAILVMTGSRI